MLVSSCVISVQGLADNLSLFDIAQKSPFKVMMDKIFPSFTSVRKCGENINVQNILSCEKKEKVISLLQVKQTDFSELKSLIQNEIKHDFLAGRVVLVEGWQISETEAAIFDWLYSSHKRL
jgi:hypothetical protein